MTDLFPASLEQRIATRGAEIFVRVLGEGPPLLLLHGYPQTHAMWHRVAPALAEAFTLVMPDLRGYGRSSTPPNDAENRTYSKRAMGEDMADVMTALGHERFAVVAHDRGARVAYRMALDIPDRIRALAVLDILPTWVVWQSLTPASAMGTYHWLFLAQPSPLPEMLIGKASEAFLDFTLASWTMAKDLSAFDPAALADYRACFSEPERIRASCDDYRAGATFDWSADEADLEAGTRIHCPSSGASTVCRRRRRARSRSGARGAATSRAGRSTEATSSLKRTRRRWSPSSSRSWRIMRFDCRSPPASRLRGPVSSLPLSALVVRQGAGRGASARRERAGGGQCAHRHHIKSCRLSCRLRRGCAIVRRSLRLSDAHP